VEPETKSVREPSWALDLERRDCTLSVMSTMSVLPFVFIWNVFVDIIFLESIFVLSCSARTPIGFLTNLPFEILLMADPSLTRGLAVESKDARSESKILI